MREVESRGKIDERDRVLVVQARRGELLTNQRAPRADQRRRDAAMHALRRLADAGLLERLGERGALATGSLRILRHPPGCASAAPSSVT